MERIGEAAMPDSAAIRNTMLALRKAISSDDAPCNYETVEDYFARGIDAVLDVHGTVAVETGGMMCNPVITIRCVDDGQVWPCATIRSLCKALRVKLP